MTEQLNEVRLNHNYSTFSVAEYESGDDSESKPIINQRVMRTNRLLEKLKMSSNIQPCEYKVDHLFPPNCRYYEQHEGGHVIVIEEPPAYRTISVDRDMANEVESLKSIGKLEEYGYENWAAENSRPYKFHLALPYTIFMFGLTKTFEFLGGTVFFRTQPISGFSDPLCKTPFLNVNDSQNVCFGEQIYKGPKRSIFADTQHLIGVFWSAIFNSDYIYNYVAYQDIAGVCDYLTWEYYSHADPMFIYKADWIQYEENVGQVVDRVRGWVISQSENKPKEINYNLITSLFKSAVEGGLAKVPGVDVEQPLIYDVSQYMFLGEDALYIGDSFLSKGKRYYIDSFLGFRKMVNPAYVNLQREDGRVFRIKLTNSVKEFIKEKVRSEKYETEAVLPNGVVLKTGDILVTKNMYENQVYRKIHYLRINQEGVLEGRFGSEFYVVENLPKDSSILDLSEPEYKGIKLEIDKEYFILKSSHYPVGPTLTVAFAKYQDITAGNRGNLVAKFVESRGGNMGNHYTIDFSDTRRDEQRLFEIESCKPLPTVFRMGRKLVYPKKGDRYSSEVSEAFTSPGLGILMPSNTGLRDAKPPMYLDRFIKDDIFKVESWDLDIEFKIGDKVVVADWKNPINMLTVKQIEGFVENTETGNISFALSDKSGNATSHEYISSINSVIHIGSIRKITNKWNELTSGMKIVSKIPGISMFPKKDSNIIIGFLYDTGGPEPLVLCSNACTLWYSDVIEKFNIIPMTNIKWKQLKHASINPSKMRFQAGDIINGQRYFHTNHAYFSYRPRESRTIRAQKLAYYGDYEESYPFDKRFTHDVIFDCFPNPRLTGGQEDDLGYVHAFPNFHGMYTVTGGYNSAYLFPNDPRSLLNVSSNSE